MWPSAISRSACRSSSASKWPLFAMIVPSRIAAKCSRRKTLTLPVAVTNSSPQAAASPAVMTWKPSISASSARTGSTSMIVTWAPIPDIRDAIPFPTQP